MGDKNNICEEEEDSGYEQIPLMPPLPCHTPPRRPRTPTIRQVDTDMMDVVPVPQPVQCDEDNMDNGDDDDDDERASTIHSSSLTPSKNTGQQRTTYISRQDSVRFFLSILVPTFT